MNETTLTRTITDIAAPLAASMGLAIWGVEAAFAKRSVIRIFVEGENGVDIDKCAELSRLLGLSLDVDDVIPGAYVLEVSSPGLERTFFTAEQLAANVGNVVLISLHSPTASYPGRKKLFGTLTGAENGTFSVTLLDMPAPESASEKENAPARKGAAAKKAAPAKPTTADKTEEAPVKENIPATFAWDDIKKAKLVHFLPEVPGTVKGKKPKQIKAPKAPAGMPENGEGQAAE